MAVGLIVVSHSALLAEGVTELAAQMAPDVTVRAVGGAAGGGLGTDHDAVAAAISAEPDSVLLYDIGSARMVAELAVESAAEPDRLRLVDAPLVEGAVAAAVAAQGGVGVDDVARAAVAAARSYPTPNAGTGEPQVTDEPALHEQLELTNETGLHARPAAMLARCLQGLDVAVVVRHGTREADAASVLALMSLDARQGDTVELLVSGPDAHTALDRVTELVRSDFTVEPA